MSSRAQIRDVLKQGITHLESAFVPSSPLAAELLLMHALGRDRTWLYTHPEEPLDSAAIDKYFGFVARRTAGEPTQYIIGKQEFWGLELEVTPAVLIPRPETEHIIEVAIERIGAARRDDKLQIADVGTGSGCIAIALAREFPNAKITATDLSPAALEVATRNAIRHNFAKRILFLKADLLGLEPSPPQSNLPGVAGQSVRHRFFDVIASNPPYIADSEAAALQREVREHEPKVALFAGPSGLEIYPRLIEQAESKLASGGLLVLELGYGAVGHVGEMIDARGVWRDVVITDDLAGIPRVLAAEFASKDTK